MKYIFVIAPFPEKEKFFIPSVLSTTYRLDIIRDPFIKIINCFVLTWDEMPIPQGLFPALIVGLLKWSILPKFKLYQPSECEMQYRNAICLTCAGYGGAVLLVDDVYWMEIYYFGPPVKCSTIKGVVVEAIKDVVKNFVIRRFSRGLENVFFALYVHLLQTTCVFQVKIRRCSLVIKVAWEWNVLINIGNYHGSVKMLLQLRWNMVSAFVFHMCTVIRNLIFIL